MDDWLSFTEAHCLTLLRDLPWRSEDLTTQDIFEKMWSLLRRAVLYFLKYVDGQHTDDRILDAQKLLLEYGRMAEEVCN